MTATDRIARQVAILNGDDPQHALPVTAPQGGKRGNALYADVGALLDGTIPEAPKPTLLYRSDGNALFYEGEVNVIFGDPESGKTFLAEAAAAAAMKAGKNVLFLDLDHNGINATVARFLDMDVHEDVLRNQERFRYVEPEDRLHLLAVVENTTSHDWAPHLAIVDSIGELLPLLGLSSNSPDDFTIAHGNVLKPLAVAGAGVIAIDHLPKNAENKLNGPTGTAAKRRAIGGVAMRVVVKEPFTPGKGGSAYLTVNKDRHGGLRRVCPTEGGRESVAGLFIIEDSPEAIRFSVMAPELGDAAKAENVSTDDLATLDSLDPPPSSVRDVRERLRWRNQRAADALRHWRSNGSQALPGNGNQEVLS